MPFTEVIVHVSCEWGNDLRGMSFCLAVLQDPSDLSCKNNVRTMWTHSAAPCGPSAAWPEPALCLTPDAAPSCTSQMMRYSAASWLMAPSAGCPPG